VPQAVFPYHDWLDKDKGMSQVLTPDRDGDGKGDAFHGAGLTEHTITVYTSDIRWVARAGAGAGAGTGAWVRFRVS